MNCLLAEEARLGDGHAGDIFQLLQDIDLDLSLPARSLLVVPLTVRALFVAHGKVLLPQQSLSTASLVQRPVCPSVVLRGVLEITVAVVAGEVVGKRSWRVAAAGLLAHLGGVLGTT